ncbi:poly-beta-hydroxybutyrate polymerase [Rhodoblastus sphagnicola]|uniref:Poly-beta-hydroxybutyrate polymerase n=1 Tax=Rhodoblastus sphagnicola TaxID=333368 RepID=A0A2S6MUG9_9HYPH|nr:alpha/beta fold hydrolase [Rhodoblastus sphagnicola]MBB4196979.1 polyhydroxyalkanoate synthase [Rhodoblastus sphagnicola]PPQ26010.1 poly-beta-hydroxybutyrate polymerase [Rhodoblastus sphagnicola]
MPESATTGQPPRDEPSGAADEGGLPGPLAPDTLTPALMDVFSHAAANPAFWLKQGLVAFEDAQGAIRDGEVPKTGRDDHRFSDPAWRAPPFNFVARNFQLAEGWLEQAARNVPGISAHHADLAAFAARQWLDAFSPSNIPWMNPEVLRVTLEQGGLNLVRGAQYCLDDLSNEYSHKRAPSDYIVGKDLAATSGKVVLRNELIELIQYTPVTEKTRPEPVLIVPAWIMKYYILDLSPHNSLIRYLVGRGYTVFCISWRNPGRELAQTCLDDYRRLGPMTALDAIEHITKAKSVHALGYCLGGTLLAATAAAMARDGDGRLASLTLLAAQTDFSEPGELKIFIDETQLDRLDRLMARQGYLEAWQMAGAFSMLRARDLVWSRIVKTYLLGEREHPNDLMAWNADATRMPYRMHSEYLRGMFLNNDLAKGRFLAGGRAVDLAAIAAPIFAVGAETDHVAPWRSVFKIVDLIPGDTVFLLASGGHNSGIVSEPGHKNRSYRLMKRAKGQPSPTPDDYLARAPHFAGSWWLAWVDWLDSLSGPPIDPPPMAPALCDAPGMYVLQR